MAVPNSLRKLDKKFQSSLTSLISISVILLIAIPSVLLICFFYQNYFSAIKKNSLKNMESNAKTIMVAHNGYLREVLNDLVLIRTAKDFSAAIIEEKGNDTLSERQKLAKFFANFIELNSQYRELRLIGLENNGKELVRVNNYNGVEIVDDKDLQEKKQRDYFIETIKLSDGEFYIGEITPRIEHKKLVEPKEYQIRFGTPVYVDGKLRAALFININYADHLNNLKKLASSDLNWEILDLNLLDEKSKNSDEYGNDILSNIADKLKNDPNIQFEKFFPAESHDYFGGFVKLSYLFRDSTKKSYILIIKTSKKEFQKDIENTAYKIISMIVAGIIITLIVLIILLNKFLSPLKLLVSYLSLEEKNFDEFEKLKKNHTEIGAVFKLLQESFFKNVVQAEKLMDVQQMAILGFWVFPIGGKKIRVSPKMLDIFDTLQNREVFVDDFKSIIYKPDRIKWEKNFKRCVEQGESFQIDFKSKMLNGDFKWIRSVCKKVDTEDKIYLLGTCQDITDQVKRREKLELLSVASGLSLIAWDLTKGELNLDKKLIQMLGLVIDGFEMSFNQFVNLIHPDDRVLFHTSISAYLENSLTYFEIKFRFLHSEGYEVPVLCKGKIIDPQPEEKVLFFYLTVLDISKLEKLEKELEKEKKLSFHNSKWAAIGEVASAISYELNDPLMVAKGYVDKILSQGEIDFDHLNKVSASLGVMEKIISMLRTFDTNLSEKETFDLMGVVQDTVMFIDEAYKQHGIEITIDSQKDNQYFIIGNIGKIRQVFLNIFSNAKIALIDSEVKKIVVKLEEDLENWKVSIMDTGIGIAPELHERIFESMFTTQTSVGEHGIGLAYTENIVMDHNGKITLESKVGEGATFIIKFPKAPEIPSGIKSLNFREILDEFKIEEKKFYILAVEDDEGVRDLLEFIFDELNVDFIIKENGFEALDLLSQDDQKIDLVISDVRMPKMDGYELLRQIRKSELIKTQPKFVFMTAGIKPEVDENNPETKYDGFIFKPFDSEVLKNILDKFKDEKDGN